MILDSDGSNCQQISIDIGGDTTISRSWDIKIMQYACGDYDSSGWPGCLQYYTATKNNIQKYDMSILILIYMNYYI